MRGLGSGDFEPAPLYQVGIGCLHAPFSVRHLGPTCQRSAEAPSKHEDTVMEHFATSAGAGLTALSCISSAGAQAPVSGTPSSPFPFAAPHEVQTIAVEPVGPSTTTGPSAACPWNAWGRAPRAVSWFPNRVLSPVGRLLGLRKLARRGLRCLAHRARPFPLRLRTRSKPSMVGNAGPYTTTGLRNVSPWSASSNLRAAPGSLAATQQSPGCQQAVLWADISGGHL